MHTQSQALRWTLAGRLLLLAAMALSRPCAVSKTSDERAEGYFRPHCYVYRNMQMQYGGST